MNPHDMIIYGLTGKAISLIGFVALGVYAYSRRKKK